MNNASKNAGAKIPPEKKFVVLVDMETGTAQWEKKNRQSKKTGSRFVKLGEFSSKQAAQAAVQRYQEIDASLIGQQ